MGMRSQFGAKNDVLRWIILKRVLNGKRELTGGTHVIIAPLLRFTMLTFDAISSILTLRLPQAR